jgi:hypothetical protein
MDDFGIGIVMEVVVVVVVVVRYCTLAKLSLLSGVARMSPV